jgi:hypothetical protein
MNTVHYAENTITEIADHIPGARTLLQEHDVVTTGRNRLNLNQAAQSVSVPTDELLAVMEYRVRRNARNNRS